MKNPLQTQEREEYVSDKNQETANVKILSKKQTHRKCFGSGPFLNLKKDPDLKRLLPISLNRCYLTHCVPLAVCFFAKVVLTLHRVTIPCLVNVCSAGYKVKDSVTQAGAGYGKWRCLQMGILIQMHPSFNG